MTSSDLRAKILVALGLPAAAIAAAPACRHAEAPETPVVDVTAVPGRTPTGKGAVASAPAGRSCALDEVLESVCGTMQAPTLQRYPFASCGPTATDIARETERRLVEPRALRDRAVLATFTFDPEETHASITRKLGETADPSVTQRTYRSVVCCYTRCTSLPVAEAADPVASDAASAVTCLPAPQRGTSAPAEDNDRCPAALRIGDTTVRFVRAREDTCCYATTQAACGPNQWRDAQGQCRNHNRGRPLRVDGRVLTASTHARSGWSSASAPRGVDTPATVERHHGAAAAWARNAAAEHASVAAFARVSLELMSLGAPAELVAACHAAALEEVEHARLSYGIASELAGEVLGPGPLELHASTQRVELVDLVRDTFMDGCVAETTAALEASEARAHARRDDIASALEVIARDEASHAALAFRIVAWGLDVGGERVRRALGELVHEVQGEPEAPPATDGGELAAVGILDARAFAVLRARAVHDVVVPCARALLA